MGIDGNVGRLTGLRLAVTGIGSTTDVLLRSWLVACGMDPDADLTIQPPGNPGAMYAAFEQGQIDGFVPGAPLTRRAELEGLGKTAIDPLDGGIPETNAVPYAVIIRNERTVAAKPDLLQRTVNALTRAMVLIRTEPQPVRAPIRDCLPDTHANVHEAFEPKFRANAATAPMLTRTEYGTMIGWNAITSSSPIDVTHDASCPPTSHGRPRTGC